MVHLQILEAHWAPKVHVGVLQNEVDHRHVGILCHEVEAHLSFGLLLLCLVEVLLVRQEDGICLP